MEKDLDMKLYNEYLNGEKGAFELLYNKYKDKIKYFVYNIVKDYQKAEDITQDVFIYVLQNKIKDGYTFKYHIFLIAKSRAISYINKEKRRNEIDERYLLSDNAQIEQDVADIVSNSEKRKEIINALNMLDDKYKNALYLVKIEELTYKETAEILGESVQNIKNLIHRGKKELRKILIKKGFEEMNKVSKIIIIVLCVSMLLAGGVYAAIKITKTFTGKAKMTPTYTSKISEMDTNKVWVGTFNLVWNDFMDDVVKEKIEFEDGPSALADELNKQSFTVSQLSENSYFKIHGDSSLELKNKIENGIKQKFNEESKIIDRINWEDPYGYVLYAMLKKEFEFLEPFSTAMGDMQFKDSDTRVKCFGVDDAEKPEASKNVEVLFYNSEEDFAIKLKTKEGEEVILYKTNGENKSFEENYQDIKKNQENYSGNIEFGKNDILRIPFIQVNNEINYDELCGRYIKGTKGMYIRQAIQTIDFELNNVGGSVKSEAVIEATKEAIIDTSRKMIFDSDFILYLKEENKEQPYFALKVDNAEVLVPTEITREPEDEENNTIVKTDKTTENTANISNNTNNNIVNNSSIINNNANIEGQESVLPVIINKEEEQNDGVITFTGIITNITDECVTIKPNNKDSRIDSTSILIKNDKSKGFETGQTVKVSFKGNVTKSYPQNVNLISIEIL